jgi:cation:H+ antiporter
MHDGLEVALGLVLLLGGAEALVRGAVWLTLTLGISPMLVGVTLVAFGTSAPELVVAGRAGLEGAPGLATGSVLGSNIANIALILGLAAVVEPITHAPRSARFECRYLLLVSALLVVSSLLSRPLGRWEGLGLLGLLLVFNVLLVLRELRQRGQRGMDDDLPDVRDRSVGRALSWVAIAAAGGASLHFGGGFLVDGASGIARAFGVSDATIGLTIVALGTSLPELATSVVAARRGHSEIALGNVLGSNVFNICLVLGSAAMLTPLPMAWQPEGAMAVIGLLLTAVLVALLHRGGIGRTTGWVLVASYVGSMALAVAFG